MLNMLSRTKSQTSSCATTPRCYESACASASSSSSNNTDVGHTTTPTRKDTTATTCTISTTRKPPRRDGSTTSCLSGPTQTTHNWYALRLCVCIRGALRRSPEVRSKELAVIRFPRRRLARVRRTTTRMMRTRKATGGTTTLKMRAMATTATERNATGVRLLFLLPNPRAPTRSLPQISKAFVLLQVMSAASSSNLH